MVLSFDCHVSQLLWLTCVFEFEFECGFYAQSASEAIFRARACTYSHNLLIMTSWWWLYLMNETRRKPTTGRQPPSLFDKWHGMFYMPCTSRHGWTYQYLWLPSHGSLGESRSVPRVGLEPTMVSQWNALTHSPFVCYCFISRRYFVIAVLMNVMIVINIILIL